MFDAITPFRSISLLLAALCFVSAGAEAAATVDGNDPLKGTLGIQDPGTIVKCNGTYYTVGTGGGGLSSTDRITWKSQSGGVAKQSWWAAHGGGLWAPDYTFLNGTYWCYYSISASMDFNSAIGLTTSPTLDPTASNYKWTDKGIVIDSAQGSAGGWGMVNVIDPSTFVDDDGRWYLCYGSFQNGVRIIELNTATGMPKDNPPKPMEITHHAGEGSAMFKANGYYYYAISQGKCCAGMSSTYAINYARATAVGGPYLTSTGGTFISSTVEGLLKGSDDASATNGSVAVGVGGFFWDHIGGTKDTLFLDYMAYTAPGGGPILDIKPVYSTSTGWLTMTPSQGTVITRSTTAIQDNTAASSTGSLHLSGNILQLSIPGWTRANLEVFDLAGRKIATSRLSVLDGHSSLDLRSLVGSGIRELRVTGDGGRVAQQVVLP
jgi:arabinan endo-1,5-alpha-L-arabinosidase